MSYDFEELRQDLKELQEKAETALHLLEECQKTKEEELKEGKKCRE